MRRSIINFSVLLTISFLIIVSFSNTTFAQAVDIECNGIYNSQAEISASSSVTLKPGFVGISGCDLRIHIDPNSPDPINYSPTTGGDNIESTPTNTQNYIIKTSMREATTSSSQISTLDHTQSIQYLDGFGRPIQSVVTQGSPNKKDIVQPFSYDDWGRVDKKYLPYVSTNDDGTFNVNAESQAISFYTQGTAVNHEADEKPYSDIIYDDSPLDRTIGIEGIGENWDSNPVTYNYEANTSTIEHWKVTDAAGTIVSVSYAPYTLHVNETIDEDGKTQRIYTDKLGQTIRVENIGDASEVLRTAYVYDDLGRLRCIVTPKSTATTPETELCYFYNYDEKGRIIEERKPGTDWSYFVYDKRNRLAMFQDANMNNNVLANNETEWHYKLYDAFNRPVATGIIQTADSQTTIQGNFDNQSSNNLYETYTALSELFGYPGTSFPSQYQPDFSSLHTVYWYDNYSHFGNNIPEYNFPSIPSGGSTSNSYITNIKGLAVGSGQIIHEAQGSMCTILLSKIFYDDKLRPICTVSDNHLGGFNKQFFAYNFNNQITEQISLHNSPYQSDIVLITKYEYDHQGRLLNEKQKIDDQSYVTTRSIKYNEIGEVINTYLHGSETGQNFNQDINTTYNIRGWLRKINDPSNLDNDLFAMELRYEAPYTSNNISVSPAFNGNISQMCWNSVNDISRGYGFTYDNLNRLTGAIYADGASYTSSVGYYNTSYTYDNNGNIIDLIRKSNNIETYDLTYNYHNSGQSNRLKNLTNNNAKVLKGDLIPIIIPYAYDNNGNMTYDPEKLMYVSYNYLNLTTEVRVGTSDYINYIYTPTGVKLRKILTSSNTPDNYTMDYCGQFIYKDNELISIFTSTGRIIPISFENDILWQYEYSLNDHLGNTRVIFAAHDNGQAEIMQQTSYYPYGMALQQQNFQGVNAEENKYLFGGKELQDDIIAGVNINLYDFGARMYDAELCRWHVVDPMAVLAPNITPYRYGFNNPIRFTDPNGMWEYDDIPPDDDVYRDYDGPESDYFGPDCTVADIGPWHDDYYTVIAWLNIETDEEDSEYFEDPMDDLYDDLDDWFYSLFGGGVGMYGDGTGENGYEAGTKVSPENISMMFNAKGFMEIMGIVNNAMNFGNKKNDGLPSWLQQLIKNAQENYEGEGKKQSQGTSSASPIPTNEPTIPEGGYSVIEYRIATSSGWYSIPGHWVWNTDTLWTREYIYNDDSTLFYRGDIEGFTKDWLNVIE